MNPTKQAKTKNLSTTMYYYGKLCCDGCFLIGAFHSELLHNMHKIKMHFYYVVSKVSTKYLDYKKCPILSSFVFIMGFLAPLVAFTKS